ncbi:hypothetical protein J2Y54_002158 [Sphingomonas sp. BE123]|uniref:hypothetical protein n=1 Tax=Sphingomonas sp. BE123 TaxID=2817842 RepID=UPI002860F7C3|nr:hypothetical protein [Sphingomonas sp. BE123]MDR6852638.1 hypothetical protein [Sphingomonas sp. BE123]
MSGDIAPNPVPRAYRITMLVICVPVMIAVFLEIGGMWSFVGGPIPLLTPVWLMMAMQMLFWPASGNLSPKANRLLGATLLAFAVLVALVSIIEFVSE